MNRFGLTWRAGAGTIALMLLTLLAGTALLGLAGHFLTAAALAGVGALGFNFFGPSAGIRALTLVRILSRYAEKLVGHDATLRLARDLRVRFFAQVLPLAPLELGRQRVGDLLARLIADIEQVEGVLVRALGPLLAIAGLGVVALTVATFALPAAGALLACTLIVLGFGVPWAVQRRAARCESERAESRAQLRTVVLERLEGAADLAALHAGEAFDRRIDDASVRLSRDERRRKSTLAAGGAAHAGVVALALPALLWLLLQAVAQARLGAAAAGGVFFMAVAVFEAGAGIAMAWQALHAARASALRLEQVTRTSRAVHETNDPTPVPAQGALRVDDVRFAWPGQPQPVLRGLSLDVPQSQRIALQGDSGAGKSSLLALLLRLRDPDAGALTFAGIDLRAFDTAQWHRAIAWLPQDAPVFAGSVRDNLLIGAPTADDASLWRALAQVKLEPAIRALPHGLDAWIGEHGATLSVGQARRIALARALLRQAPLLLLDEPTEGLDADTARAFLADLVEASAGRTVVIVSHDPLPTGTVHATYRLQDGALLRVE